MKFAIYSFCAGALAMYFWDPVSGRRRRALFRDQLVHMRHEIEDTAEGLAKDVRNRAQGVAAETRGAMRRTVEQDRPEGQKSSM
jgi:hypothetical protein